MIAIELKYDNRIVDEFNGWDDEAVFELSNGTKWKQKKYKYKYKYKYRPKAKIWKDGSRYYIEVECMNEMIEVEKI